MRFCFKEQLWAKSDFHSFSFPPGWNSWNLIEPLSSQRECNKHCTELAGSHWGPAFWNCHVVRILVLPLEGGRSVTKFRKVYHRWWGTGGGWRTPAGTSKDLSWEQMRPPVSSYRARRVLQNYWGTSEVWRMADHLFFCLPGQGGNNDG